MAKQNFLDRHFTLIMIVALIVVGAYWANGQTWDFSKFNLGNLLTIVTNVNIASQNNTQGPQGNNQTGTNVLNLCQAYQPVYDAFVAAGYPHPQVACTAGGGTWKCDGTHAGCYGYLGNINCTGYVFQYSAFSCNSYRATFTCNQHNAYCQY